MQNVTFIIIPPTYLHLVIPQLIPWYLLVSGRDRVLLLRVELTHSRHHGGSRTISTTTTSYEKPITKHEIYYQTVHIHATIVIAAQTL